MEVMATPGFKRDAKVCNRFFYAPEDADADITICRTRIGRRLAIRPDKNMRSATIICGKIHKNVPELVLTEDPSPKWCSGYLQIFISDSNLDAKFAKPTDKCTNCGSPAKIVMRSYPPGSTSLGIGKFCDACLHNGVESASRLICHICRQRGGDIKLVGTTPYTGHQSSATCREFRVHESCVAELNGRLEFRKRIKIRF